MSVYAEAKALGIETDNHESDLYIKDSPATRELLKRHGILPERGKSIMFFTSQIDGETWIDLPFQYEPFWERVAARVAAAKG